MISKTCISCKEVKFLRSFSKNKTRASGYQPYCKLCMSIYRKKKRDATPVQERQNWYSRNKSKLTSAQLKSKYGITLDQYNQMLANQNGQCKICATQPEKSLCVDHDHATGKIRGLLCGPCNRMLGMAKDQPAILESAILYLKPQV